MKINGWTFTGNLRFITRDGAKVLQQEWRADHGLIAWRDVVEVAGEV